MLRVAWIIAFKMLTKVASISSTHHTAAFKFDLSLDGFKTTKALSCGVAERKYLRRHICRSK
jgi:hypothetical protein